MFSSYFTVTDSNRLVAWPAPILKLCPNMQHISLKPLFQLVRFLEITILASGMVPEMPPAWYSPVIFSVSAPFHLPWQGVVSVNVGGSPGRTLTIPWIFPWLFSRLTAPRDVPWPARMVLCLFPLINISFCLPAPPTTDSENSLLRYLSDDKILVIQEEPLGQKDNKRDTGRRSRKKGKPPGNPSYPISPSVLASTMNVRLEPGQQDVLSFSLAENNTVPLYHVSAPQTPPWTSHGENTQMLSS